MIPIINEIIGIAGKFIPDQTKIAELEAELSSKMEKSSLWEEDISLGITLIMIDAFMRCKILEEPPKK